MARALSEAFAVRLPVLLTVVLPATIPPFMIVVVPPERLAKPVILAELMTVPPDWVRFEILPPGRLAVPDETTRALREAFAVRLPVLLTVVLPATIPLFMIAVFPPERLAKPVILATLITVPPD